jgi:S-adenosylmethionine hydrolase
MAEAFVRGQGGFVVAVDAAAVVDPAVGAFRRPIVAVETMKPCPDVDPDPALATAPVTVWIV